ncbi:transposase [Streptomyces sp. NPDC058459]|uniref:transposase n=1 Tax=Streptomyces sp. NPDC058459 TaxID=3346508 RepID=UPI0036612D96
MPLPPRLEGCGWRPKGFCHRKMLDSVRCIVTDGITWRALPADFPAWDRVYTFFRAAGVTPSAHRVPRPAARPGPRGGRDTEPSAGVIDAESVRGAASVPAARRSFGGGQPGLRRREGDQRPRGAHRPRRPRSPAGRRTAAAVSRAARSRSANSPNADGVRDLCHDPHTRKDDSY